MIKEVFFVFRVEPLGGPSDDRDPDLPEWIGPVPEVRTMSFQLVRRCPSWFLFQTANDEENERDDAEAAVNAVSNFIGRGARARGAGGGGARGAAGGGARGAGGGARGGRGGGRVSRSGRISRPSSRYRFPTNPRRRGSLAMTAGSTTPNGWLNVTFSAPSQNEDNVVEENVTAEADEGQRSEAVDTEVPDEEPLRMMITSGGDEAPGPSASQTSPAPATLDTTPRADNLSDIESPVPSTNRTSRSPSPPGRQRFEWDRLIPESGNRALILVTLEEFRTFLSRRRCQPNATSILQFCREFAAHYELGVSESYFRTKFRYN